MYIGNSPVPTASQRRYFNVFLSDKQIVDIPGGYTPGNIVVFIDGDLLLPSDYTATNGISVNLGSMYPAGTKFYMEEVSNFQIGDATTLGGVSPSNYARKDIPETFNSDVTINGTLTAIKSDGASGPAIQAKTTTGSATIRVESMDGSESAITMVTSSSNNNEIRFVNTGNSNYGMIDYDHSDGAMRFFTNNSERIQFAANGTIIIANTGALNFGSATRQMINLYSTTYAIGVQSNTTYFRSAGNFAWFRGGDHDSATLKPGAGGTTDMSLVSGVLTLHSGALREKRNEFTTSIDWSLGNSWSRSVSGNVTITESYLPTAGTSQTIIVRINYTSGNITWPASWKWIGGNAPTLSAGQNFIIVTCDGNSNVFATYAGKH